jgi:hypothetical protein
MCPRLNTLDVTDCYLITDVGIVRLAEGCPKLKNLSKLNITDVSLIRLAEVYPNLHTLGLAWCLSITEMGINKLAKGCVNLRSLDLYDCHIKVAAMEKLSKKYPKLKIHRTQWGN